MPARSIELGGVPTFANASAAIVETQPDAVSINTYPDTHYALCKEALEAGAHVFIEIGDLRLVLGTPRGELFTLSTYISMPLALEKRLAARAR